MYDLEENLMNKIYKVIWNVALGAWVAVSELAKGKTKTNGYVGANILKQEQESTFQKPNFYFIKFNPVSAVLVAVGAISSQSYAVTGIYVNDGVDSGCAHYADPYTAIGSGGTTNQALCTDPITNRNTVTNKAMFFGADGVDGSDSLILSGQAYINSGSLGLGGGQTGVDGTNSATGSIRIGGGRAAVSGLNTNGAGVGTLGAISGQYAIAIGGGETDLTATIASGNKSIAMGFNTKTAAVNGIAIGSGSAAQANNNISLGANAITGLTSSSVDDAKALGLGNNSTSGGQIAIGSNAKTDTVGSIALGANAVTGGASNFAIAIGALSNAAGNSAIAFGRRAQANGQNSLALGGRGTTSEGTASTAIGSFAQASGQESTAIGGSWGEKATAPARVVEQQQQMQPILVM